MFAIIEVSGHQYKVEKGQKFSAQKVEANEGDVMQVPEVLLVNKDGAEDIAIGAPFVAGASVELKVLKQYRGDKVRVFKMKSKKRSRKTFGHRTYLTEFEVTGIKA